MSHKTPRDEDEGIDNRCIYCKTESTQKRGEMMDGSTAGIVGNVFRITVKAGLRKSRGLF
jgi:hypothetical protein